MHRATLLLALPLLACGSSTPDAADDDGPAEEEVCELAEDADAPDELAHLGCAADFAALASLPLDQNLPGARSVKVVHDHADADALHFQNSTLYQIHYDFCSAHLSGGDLPIVPALADFNAAEYFTPDRRFNLGAVTYYEQPDVWALEVAPYDTASADMLAALFYAVQDGAFFRDDLVFHPTSEAVAREAESLPDDIPVMTTDELYARIDYQPLSLATGVGRLRFLDAAELATTYVSYQEILVLDEAPNDISVVQGLITEEFQTPLSHVNVLSLNRRTPNMGLRGATTDERLRALEGKLVELVVGAGEWTIREASEAEAEAAWDASRPDPVTLPPLDLSVQELVDIADVTPEPEGDETLRDAIKTSVRAFGGKAAHYSILFRTDGVPIAPAFAVPMFFYDQFMQDNGFYARIDDLLLDPEFASDPAVRDAALAGLRADMQDAPLDGAFQATLKAKLAAEFPGHAIRFRTSTNSEDLDGFPCAGCYESHTGDPGDWPDVLDAIRETYASAWLYRTFEERAYYGIDHKSIGMALLVHRNFPEEEANGVAVTGNPFDPSGLDPALYVNVQKGGDVEVVAPPPGVTSDQYLHYFSQPNQPISYLAHSSLVDAGETVLTAKQSHELGLALAAIHARFSAAYGPAAGNSGWYAMDIEFKFDDEAAPGEPAALYIKQARPYPARE